MPDRKQRPPVPVARGMLEALPEPVRARLLSHALPVDVPRGGVLYREGGPPRCALVRSGLIRVFARSAEGRQVTVRYARPNDLLGVAAAVAGPSRVAVQALADSTLLFFDAAALAEEARRDATVAWAVAEEVGHRLYEAIDQIVVHAFGTVRARTARHLLDAATPGKQEYLVAAVTQQELANAVGSAREVVARVLRNFRNDGLVRTRPGGVVLTGAEALVRIAAGERERV